MNIEHPSLISIKFYLPDLKNGCLNGRNEYRVLIAKEKVYVEETLKNITDTLNTLA
jgi:hypothetical protein